MKVITDIFRVWIDEDGTPAGLMVENGSDTMYRCKRATKADKDELFASTEKTNPPPLTI